MAATLTVTSTSSIDPWAVQDRISAQDGRLSLASFLKNDITGNTKFRSGVFGSGDNGGTGGSQHTGLRVTPGTLMQVLVNAGNCVIDSSGNGPYVAHLPVQTALTIAAASGTQNRYDVIIARIRDDQNPAIGSSVGDRQFCLEVWQGDYATGTPVVPTPAVPAGYITLGIVYVGKTVTSFTQSNITDSRGPSLATRGGRDVLFGADAVIGSTAFNRAGSFPGDERFVYGNGTFQHQAYYGNNTDTTKSGWHGIDNSIVYTASPGGDRSDGTVGNTAEITRVVIPDPGVPYSIRAWGRIALNMNENVNIDLRVALNSAAGTLLNWQGFNSFGVPSSGVRQFSASVSGSPSGPYTGSKTVFLSASIREQGSPSGGWSTNGSDGALNLLTVEIRPYVNSVV